VRDGIGAQQLAHRLPLSIDFSYEAVNGDDGEGAHACMTRQRAGWLSPLMERMLLLVM
jgi:hypothetical protein